MGTAATSVNYRPVLRLALKEYDRDHAKLSFNAFFGVPLVALFAHFSVIVVLAIDNNGYNSYP